MPVPAGAYTNPRPLTAEEVFRQACRSLQQELGRHDQDEHHEAPLTFYWCSLSAACHADLGALVTGAAVVLQLTDGRVLIGDLVALRRRFSDPDEGEAQRPTGGSLVLQVWGRPRPLRLPLVSLVAARVVGAHSWREEQHVRDCQRRNGHFTPPPRVRAPRRARPA